MTTPAEMRLLLEHGCQSGSCRYRKPGGMHHNGPCRCNENMRNHLPALLDLWEAIAHEHDPRFREIASENHENCPICNILKRLEAGRG